MAKRRIPAIIAVGSSLAALPASALELGEMTVQSRLGQPLRASIAYALAPNEQLSDYCVTMRAGPSMSGLPGFGVASVSVANLPQVAHLQVLEVCSDVFLCWLLLLLLFLFVSPLEEVGRVPL